MSASHAAVIGNRRSVLLAALISAASLAACGDGGSTDAERSAGAEAVASSRALEACIKDWGGRGTVVDRPGEGFSDLQAHEAFDVRYPDGTSFSVAVEKTGEDAQLLQTRTQGVLVGTELVNESVSEEAPAEMREAAAETVHRVGNVVIMYSNPRHDDDAGVRRCVTGPR